MDVGREKTLADPMLRLLVAARQRQSVLQTRLGELHTN